MATSSENKPFVSTREKPFSDKFLSMTPEERHKYLKEATVNDRSKIPEKDRAILDSMHRQLQREMSSDPELTNG